MKVKVIKSAAKDRLILADSREVLAYAEDGDLECRRSQHVENKYHKDWFYHNDKGTCFSPPAVYLEKGVIKFLNGRHRFVLLSRHLDNFPMLVGHLDFDHLSGVPSNQSTMVLDKIRVSKLQVYSSYELPDLEYGNFEPS